MNTFITWTWLVVLLISLITFVYNLSKIKFWACSADTFRKYYTRCVMSAWVVISSPFILLFAEG